MSEVNLPKNNKYVESKKRDSKNRIEQVFDEYKGLLRDKTHPDNQTAAYNNNVISVLNRLLVAADELDSVNPGEGIFGLIILCLRTNLKLKDDNTVLEVRMRELELELKRLKKSK